MKSTIRTAPLGAIEYRKLHFTPSRGGHAPDTLRVEFEELVCDASDVAAQEERLERLCGLLWNCTDIMPSDLCQELDLPQGSTYAQGARHLKSAEATM